LTLALLLHFPTSFFFPSFKTPLLKTPVVGHEVRAGGVTVGLLCVRACAAAALLHSTPHHQLLPKPPPKHPQFVGTIESLGSEVTGLSMGDRVMCPFTCSCSSCFYCSKGKTCRCLHPEAQLFGWLSEPVSRWQGSARLPSCDTGYGSSVLQSSMVWSYARGSARLTVLITCTNSPTEGGRCCTHRAEWQSSSVCARAPSIIHPGQGEQSVPPHPTVQHQTPRHTTPHHTTHHTTPHRTTPQVPPDVSDDQALLLGDILSTAFFCTDQGGVSPGDTVTVVGCGPVGLLAVLAAQERGATTVFAVDGVPSRRARAAAFGARAVEPAAAVEAVKAATEGRGADVVLEAVGAPSALKLAFDLVRPAGVLSSVGVQVAPGFPFTPVEAYDKNATLRCGVPAELL